MTQLRGQPSLRSLRALTLPLLLQVNQTTAGKHDGSQAADGGNKGCCFQTDSWGICAGEDGKFPKY